MKEKPNCWKLLNFITELRLYSIGLPIVCGLLLSTYLMGSTKLGPTWGTLLGFMPGFIFFTILTLPIWFVKQTQTPSSFQRFCRNYVIGIAQKLSFLSSRSGNSIQRRDIRFFQYYLSHPQKPENIWADQTDTTLFDWQDPKQWPL